MLAEEFQAVHGQPPPVYPPEADEDARLETMYAAIHARPQSALCLSGGGIRSATFCLGVLQGLARCGLLGKFDYLSTVSGGGYIGSWLTAWMHRSGAAGVVEALRANPTSKIKPEPEQISHLRSFSNYLSPRIGVLSADTWTLVAIYLRNLFLNWLVFLPLLMAVLALPRIYVWILRQGRREWGEPGEWGEWGKWVGELLILCGLVLGASALAYIGSHRPSLRKNWVASGGASAGLNRFGLWCLLPLVSAVLLMTVGRAWFLNAEEYWKAWHFVVFGAALHALGWLFTFIWVLCFFGWAALSNYTRRWPSRLVELLVVPFTGALGGGFLWLLSIPAKSMRVFQRPADEPELYAVFDGPLLMLVFLLMGILSVGVGSRSMNDEDREWWARTCAWVLIVIMTWALLNSLVLYGPYLLTAGHELAQGTASHFKMLGLLGLISGLITLIFGMSSRTPANERGAEGAKWLTTVMEYGLKLAAPMFALFLVVVLSLLMDGLLLLVKYVPQIKNVPPAKWRSVWEALHLGVAHDETRTIGHIHRDLLLDDSIDHTLILFGALLCVSVAMAMFINVNQFSLHSMYRNRLIRAYLGASNKKRNHDAFTGFDPTDDLRMSDLWPNGGWPCAETGKKPLHVLNMTWNMVRGKNLAWQNRKAASFTVSPLHSGNHRRGYRRSAEYGGSPDDAITLGTALTISGAAASPNMGYYSSPAITFLMTLFNARLGWWLGNPGRAKYRKAGPALALWPIIQEAFGRTEDDKDYIYLSDGGHFENLGLYEMVLRRCHYIVVIDASRDPAYQFDNLGNAIRIIRVDLGVPIEIKDISIYPRSQNKPGTYCAVGKILYTKVNEAADGVLIYIKPTITRQEPTDIFNYAQAHMDFPHESTSDQWFSEQQFESYRMLGLHAIEHIFGEDWTEDKGFGDLKPHVKKYVNGPEAAGDGAAAPAARPPDADSSPRGRRVKAGTKDAGACETGEDRQQV